MKILVQKFGGTSLGSIVHIRLAAKKITAARKEGYSVIVVVSAMGNETDELLALAKAVNPDLSAREYDMLLSTGEQKSMALLAMAIQAEACFSLSLCGWQAGIMSNQQHSHAKIIDIQTKKITTELMAGKVVVVAGFQAVTDQGEITTLGRGGSDLSAVALAAAFNAVECQIFTDVNGVHTADPRLIHNTSKLDHVSYAEMITLASLGAKVLHGRAVKLAEKLNVSLRVLSSIKPGSGTLIDASQAIDSGLIGMALQQHLIIVTLNAVETRGVLIKKMRDCGVDVSLESDVGTSCHFVVPREQVYLVEQVFSGTKYSFDLEKNVALLTIVGVGEEALKKAEHQAEKLFEKNNVSVLKTSIDSMKCAFLLSDEEAKGFCGRLHDELTFRQEISESTV